MRLVQCCHILRLLLKQFSSQKPQARAPSKKRNPALKLLARSYARLESAATVAADRGVPYLRNNPVVMAGIAFAALILLLVVLFRPF